jgi:hypothetical protein
MGKQRVIEMLIDTVESDLTLPFLASDEALEDEDALVSLRDALEAAIQVVEESTGYTGSSIARQERYFRIMHMHLDKARGLLDG